MPAALSPSLSEPLSGNALGENIAVESNIENHSLASSYAQKRPKRVSLSRLPIVHQEPIELQIETMSPMAGRFMFYSWYALLLLAITIQSIVTLQWQSTNMCDGNEVSLTKIETWSSNCANQFNYSVLAADNATNDYSDIVWSGFIENDPLARFPHIVFSMQNPNATLSAAYTISFGYTITNASHAIISSLPNSTIAEYTVLCTENHARCSTVVIPTTSTGRPNATLVTLIAVGVPQAIASRIVVGSAVGTVHQKRSYTIASLVVRYTLMFFSLLQLARFLYHKKFTSTLYEQTWISFLHAGLFLYLDPLFAAGVYILPQPNVLSFLEFRIPTYFMALMVAFMFSLITSSMSWSEEGARTGLFGAPWWSKIASIVFLLSILTLDIIDASKDHWKWSLEHCPNFSCNTIGYLLYGLLIVGVLICTVWLYWLRNNLGQRPYLDSRPQQLAVRVFIFMFSTTVLYFVIQSLTILFAYRDISGIVTYQALIQIPPILVSVFFVNIMTLVYTTQERSQRVPIRPSDLRWKKTVWPESWYQWLSRHGGSMYIFFSEAEESEFYTIQARFANRRARSLMNDGASPHKDTSYDHNTEMLVAEEVENPDDPTSKITFDLADENEDDDNEAEYDDSTDDDDDDNSPSESPRSHEPVAETSPTARSPLRSSGGLSASRVSFEETTLTHSKKKRSKRKNGFVNRIPGGTTIMNAVSSVTRSMSRLVVRAESQIIDRTATFLEAVENRFIDTFHANVRHKPFFNLETALDCLNLSWEAYGVSNSAGDQMITTGVNVRLPSVPNPAKKTMKAITSVFNLISGSEEAAEKALPVTPAVAEEDEERAVHSTSPTREYGTTSLPSATQQAAASAEVPINVEQYGFARIAVCEREDVQVVVSKMDLTCPAHAGKCPRIVVAFRGTASLRNAKQDLNIRRVAWEEIESTLWQSASLSRPSVHEGFLGIWNALREFVLMTVLEEMHKDPSIPYRIVVTGHSMGGAVATLCAFVLKKTLSHLDHPLPDPFVYTYGQPRIGNKSFQKIYNRIIPNTFRVVNESDAVSFVTMLGGCHVGMEVDIDRHGNYLCEPMFIERTLRPMKGKGSAIGNHMLSAYAESLNAIANKVNACKQRCLVPYVSIPRCNTSSPPSVRNSPEHNENPGPKNEGNETE